MMFESRTLVALHMVLSQTAQVPSGFYLTDCLLALDRLLAGNFLVPAEDGSSSKTTMAAADAKRIKKLLGSLRHLFRNRALAIRGDSLSTEARNPTTRRWPN